MKLNLVVVDDFYSNVNEVREFALSQEFSVEGNYPGVRTLNYINESTKQNIEKILYPHTGKVTEWMDGEGEYTGSFQLTTAMSRSWVHADIHNMWAGVLYLTPEAPLEGGTGFYRSKVDESLIGLNEIHNSIHSQDMSKWELVSEVHNIYNRLILFRANQWHTSQTYFGNSNETGRLTQVFFFNTEY